jgi:uncharacterized protein YndB with AHSA1/START domain
LAYDNTGRWRGFEAEDKETVMGSLVRLILGLGALVLILAAVALGLPAHVTVSRSVVINAPEHAIFPYLNDLRRFPKWSPWAARDPNMKVTFSGPPTGAGAKIMWVSEVPSVGSGSIEIVKTNPPHSMDLTADYNGVAGTSTYTLAPSGAGSKVTWTFGYDTGSSPFKRWKALMLDSFIGAEYTVGLDKLRARVESDRKPIPQPVIVAPQAAPEAEGSSVPEAMPGETAVPRTPAQGAQQTAPKANTPPPPLRRQ